MPITAIINKLFGPAGYEDAGGIVAFPGVVEFSNTVLANSWRRLTRWTADLDKRFKANEQKIKAAENGILNANRTFIFISYQLPQDSPRGESQGRNSNNG